MPCGTMAVTECYMSYFSLCLLLTSVTANLPEVCIGNKYVAQNQKAIISCDYTKSFYTVRWFLDDIENPLLRIDDTQKSGSGFDSGEYDIQMDGSMVIKRATIEHEGSYTMSVLGKDGSLTTGRINIHVVGMSAENNVYLGDMYVDLHSRISISCECNPLFSTVYWFLYDSDISILFIDDGVKGGSGFNSGEYDITDDGAMTINSADKRHNGKYKVFVLDLSGGGTTKTLMVHVTVPINTLTILDCHSSQSELCVKDEVQTTFLVCDARDFWPSIKLQWLKITQNGSTPLPTDTTTTFDESSLLFSSTSTLKYFPESFSYQYFTCVASGTAAYKVSNNSIVIEGNIPFQKLPPVDAHLMKGSDLKLACPLDDLPFGQLQLEFRNGTNKLINIINPYCANNGTCVESDSKVTTIANINYEDEGSYTCISTNGEIATTRVTHVTTIILPGKSSTIFGGCERVKGCSRTLSTSGSVTCSISGVRPPVQLSLEIDYVEEAVKDKLMLNNKGESITQDDSTGTSTTTLTFDYEVPECTEMIRLRCFSLPDEYNRHFQESTLLLQADVDVCSTDESGSAIVVVIFVIVVVIIGIVVTGVFIFRRKAQRKVTKQTRDIEIEEKTQQPFLSEQHHDQENENKEKQQSLNVDKKTSKKSESQKKKFDDLMKAHVNRVENNQTERKDLQTLLQEFKQNYKYKDDIWPLLKSFVEAESLKHETTLSLAKEFAACERNDWLSSEKSVVEMLDIVFKKQQLSFQDRLKIANEMHVDNTISLKEYASETINNFEGHKEEFREVFNEQITTQETVEEDVIGTMFECLAEYLKKCNDSKEEDDRDKFLDTICHLQTDLHVILYTLLLCIEKNAGDVKQITAVLQDNINETEIREYCGMIPELQWLTIHTLVQFRKGLTRKGLHTDDVLLIELTTLFVNGQLPTSTFLAELESSRNENLISEKTRTTHICSWATKMSDNIPTEVIYGAIQRGLIEVKTFVETVGDKWNNEDGVKLLLHMSKTNNESEKRTPHIFQHVIRHYKIGPRALNLILDSLKTPEDERIMLLTNAEVSEALLEEKFDDKWGKEDWVKFLLVISQRNQQIDEKAADFFLVAIKTFKITPSDLESIFESLNTPNEERIKVLTNEKVAEHFLNQKLDEKWGKENWFNFLLLQSKGSEIFEPKANEVFIEAIKRFKITLSGMDSILGSLKISNEQRVMILKNEKVSEYFLKQPFDMEWDKACWVHFLLLNSNENKQEFRKQIMELLLNVIKNFMMTPTDMKTILDKIEISEIKKEKIMTNKEIQRKLRKREEERTGKQKQTEKTVNKDASAENVIKKEDVKADEDVKDEKVEKNQTDETGKPIENTERNEESDHVQAVQNPVDAKEAATDKTDTEVDAEISKDITPTMGTNTSMDGN